MLQELKNKEERLELSRENRIVFKYLNDMKIRDYKAQKMASYLNHTATTDYLCCVPTLEESQELVV